ncbi:phosphoglycerate dehydrogenase [Gallaecimonas xiamenensis]|uniref:Phosphoglycerate dehydrogenase n=1 Tax=Gallaecimonas xiamenensis 3-C-1 TaxID=745411 RepID=K2JJ95_9GAMM|nr:phosphoglycerate dehydrogenase [Gallaecimonas xiamenensis]EKE75368.1 phosphoglycerate dehydrogenase [Gallaecimonas xiamenensis 3-C-1]
MKILVTCPPMLGMKEQFLPILEKYGVEVFCPDVVQTLSEEELIQLVPGFDGWIIGDDPATRAVFESGKIGKLKAAVKWGIGVDNVDFQACDDLNIPITNTPNMFGAEVADIGVGYLIALARETFYIDREIRKGNWPKNRGISLHDKKVGLIGYGDIGRNAASRLVALGMNVLAYDPGVSSIEDEGIKLGQWPHGVEDCDFLFFTCSLNKKNYHMLDAKVLGECKRGIRIVNVARGPLIDENALCDALKSGSVHSAALDVFEIEPLPMNSYLREHPLCIMGSHNSSNTIDAVAKTNEVAIGKLMDFLGIARI